MIADLVIGALGIALAGFLIWRTWPSPELPDAPAAGSSPGGRSSDARGASNSDMPL